MMGTTSNIVNNISFLTVPFFTKPLNYLGKRRVEEGFLYPSFEQRRFKGVESLFQ
jgi:hypothetical protein